MHASEKEAAQINLRTFVAYMATVVVRIILVTSYSPLGRANSLGLIAQDQAPQVLAQIVKHTQGSAKHATLALYRSLIQ